MRAQRLVLPWLAAFLFLGGAPISQAAELPIIDAHSQVDHLVDLERVIELMDEARVSRTILGRRGKLTAGPLIALARRYPERITPAVRTKGGAYRKNKPRYYENLDRQLGMAEFGAMSEVIMWHAQKGDMAAEVIVPPDDARVQAALAGSRKKGWPFVVHIEFAAAGRDYLDFMEKFEAMLRADPAHPFLLIHMGQLEASEAARLLRTHGNLHFITSHSNPVTVGRSKQPWVNMFDGNALAPEWTALMVRYPDRFVLGFDNVWADHWGDYYLEQVTLWRQALEALPATVANAVAHGNAERLWRLPPAR